MISLKLNELLRDRGESINSLSEAINTNRTSLTKLANNEAKMVQFETIDKLMAHFDLYSFDDLFVNKQGYDYVDFDIDFYDDDPHPNPQELLCWVYLYKKTDGAQKKVVSVLPISLRIKRSERISSYTFLCLKDKFMPGSGFFEFFNNYLKRERSEKIELFLMNICEKVVKGMVSRKADFSSRDIISFKTDFNNTANYLWPYYLLSDKQLSKDLYTSTTD